MALVAIQAALGQYCFLTLIQSTFEHASTASREPFWFDEFIFAAVFWPIPLEVFLPLYLLGLGLTIWFWIWVRPSTRLYASERK